MPEWSPIWSATNVPEDPLALAERQVRSFEENVARQKTLLEKMERDGHPQIVVRTREVLAAYEESLRLARERLRTERVGRGLRS